VSPGHALHAASLTATTLVEYLAAAQLVHVLFPAVEYFPKKHNVQSSDDIAPVIVEYLPASQDTHETLCEELV
jgi:hypothetical protein